MKYIIDVPEDRISAGRLRVLADMENSMTYWIETGIRVTPYEEPSDTAEDAWSFAGRIIGFADDALSCKDLGDCYGTEDACEIIDRLSYGEAKEQYEAWKKEKDEIHVGDEVGWGDSEPFVVLTVGESGQPYYRGITASGMLVECYVKYKKTGRHFPEAAELLKKMRETE